MLAVITRRAAGFELRFYDRSARRLGPPIVDTWDELLAIVRAVIG